MRFRTSLRMLALVALLAGGLLPSTVAGQDGEGTRVKASQLIKSVVLIYTFQCDQPPEPGERNELPFKGITCDRGVIHGSGAVIDQEGRVLTNNHVVNPHEHGFDVNPDRLGWYFVLITVDAKELPVPAYFGRIVTSNADLDLAILEPMLDPSGEPIDSGADLGLPVLPMAPDPGTVEIEDTLRLLGYPRDHPTITVSTVQVVGFEPDEFVPQLGGGAWIRTDVGSAGPGNSGGPAVNDQGQQVGVVSAGTRTQLSCADINSDGFVDPGQECGAAAGGSEYLRPVPDALALLQGEPTEEPTEEPDDTPEPPEPPEEPTPTEEGPPEPPTEPTPSPTPPADEPAPPSGETAIVTGTIVSADTGDPIRRAQVVVLKPGYDIIDWRRERVGSEAIHAFVLTDERGFFQIPEPVVKGEAYGIWIQAAGYRTLAKDGFVFANEDDPDVIDLGVIEMLSAK